MADNKEDDEEGKIYLFWITHPTRSLVHYPKEKENKNFLLVFIDFEFLSLFLQNSELLDQLNDISEVDDEIQEGNKLVQRVK